MSEGQFFFDGTRPLGAGKKIERASSDNTNVVRCPFVVIVDTREQTPYFFEGHEADKADGGGVLEIEVRQKALVTGDYSIAGFEDEIAIERKNVDDFVQCCSRERDRFLAQLTRLSKMPHAMVMVEASWMEVWDGVYSSAMPPKSVVRSVLSWMLKFDTVHWFFAPNRWIAEEVTFRFLELHFKHGI